MMRTALCVCLFAVTSVAAGTGTGKWMSGDFHQHTNYTDGSNIFDFVMAKNAEYGLDWWANSEHGGKRSRDGIGEMWDNPRVYAPNVFLGDSQEGDGHREMWRWQSLRYYVWPDILRNRKLRPEKRIFSGLEWNVLGHEHCSTAIVADDATAISAFEYMFDGGDSDTSREGEATEYGVLTKQNGKRYQWIDGQKKATRLNRRDVHLDAVAACDWMQQQFDEGRIDGGWIIWAHVERQGDWNTGGYNIEHFRNFNNIAPDVCFGFEGIPGHQASGRRGGFGSGAFGGGTYGGAGRYVARVGGLWDALLGEGRHWFNFASSDYHGHVSVGGSDFYPGEYQKTWAYVVDENADGDYSLKEIAAGLRSGNGWTVMGDLIDALEFTASQGDTVVPMGADMRAKKGTVTLTIKFASPMKNHNGDAPVVDHIDLIAGEITGPVCLDSPDYTKASNETAKVIATFTPSDWTVDATGSNVITAEVRADRDTYYRLRGTNHAPNTAFETDEAGNPLADALATENLGLDRAEEAWADLWFYSNPIFIYVD